MDLNALVTNNSNVTLQIAYFINDRGEIVASGVLSNGDARVFLLVPDGDCDDDCEQRTAESQNNRAVQPANPGTALPVLNKAADSLRNPFGRRFSLPRHAAVSSNN